MLQLQNCNVGLLYNFYYQTTYVTVGVIVCMVTKPFIILTIDFIVVVYWPITIEKAMLTFVYYESRDFLYVTSNF